MTYTHRNKHEKHRRSQKFVQDRVFVRNNVQSFFLKNILLTTWAPIYVK